MGNSNTSTALPDGVSYALSNSIDYGEGRVRDFLSHVCFGSVEKKHAEYLADDGNSLDSDEYDDFKNIELVYDVIDFYFPPAGQESLERYAKSFGCSISWRPHLPALEPNPYAPDEKKSKPKPRVPEFIGTLHFDLQSKAKLMAIDAYASRPFDKLAETCLYYKLVNIGIPAAICSGWIVAKPNTSKLDHKWCFNVAGYIDSEVSKKAQLQCTDVSTLQSYHDNFDKYFTSNNKCQDIMVVAPVVPAPPTTVTTKKKTSKQKRKDIMVVAPVVPAPPKKKHRAGL